MARRPLLRLPEGALEVRAESAQLRVVPRPDGADLGPVALVEIRELPLGVLPLVAERRNRLELFLFLLERAEPRGVRRLVGIGRPRARGPPFGACAFNRLGFHVSLKVTVAVEAPAAIVRHAPARPNTRGKNQWAVVSLLT